MKQPLRNSFQEADFPEKILPENHRKEFAEKLKRIEIPNNQGNKNTWWYAVAASALLLVALGIMYTLWNSPEEAAAAPEIANQMKKMEATYLVDIDKEWENFLAVAKDERLINRYREKLDELDADYNMISKEYYEDQDNIVIVEQLVLNLQTRLSLLKDIQEHIKLLNQKNKKNEELL